MSSTELVIDYKDLEFCMNDWLKIGDLSQYKKFENFDTDTCNLMLTEAGKFSEEVLFPTRAESDKVGCHIDESGQGRVPEIIKKPYQKAYELGWASLCSDENFGGQGAPNTLGFIIKEGFAGANVGLSMYFGLTEGAARLILSFGTQEQKETFVPNMLAGVHTGTMCLSEPQAGSDVGENATTAEKIEGDAYKIKGTKCWISSGDNDLSENIIHLVLARIKGAPTGTKGLSLFIVPKIRMKEDGTLGESNDVVLAHLEHKMGINCSATAVLNFGENDQCVGYLLGEEHKGIGYMFQMMNEARLGTASLGVSVASAAYQNALTYAKERKQGPHINELRNPEAPRVAIIHHPDVRLMLANMKARVEASRALLLGTAYYLDLYEATDEEEEKKKYDDFVQILTPMCKGFATEAGIDVVRDGIQVLGGVGYTTDFPMEQLYRDLRISAIYEGTTGIQALDLVGRKMTMKNGALFINLLGAFGELIEENQENEALASSIQLFSQACETLSNVAMGAQALLKERGMEGPALYATPMLMFTSAVTSAYFLLQQCVVALQKREELQATGASDDNTEVVFYQNKLTLTHFFLENVVGQYECLVTPSIKKNLDPLQLAF